MEKRNFNWFSMFFYLPNSNLLLVFSDMVLCCYLYYKRASFNSKVVQVIKHFL